MSKTCYTNDMRTIHKGFTLVEIGIVTTIIVLLGVAILLAVNPITQIFKGYDSVRKADLNKLRIAFENYYEDHLCYPTFPIDPVTGRYTYTCGGANLKPYLDAMPCDPNTGLPYDIYVDLSLASEKNCPTNFAIYSTLTNLFDPAGSKIPTCVDTISVYNSGAGMAFVITGCSKHKVCSRYYGCTTANGVYGCHLVAQDTLPTCGDNYCDDPNCTVNGQNGCTDPAVNYCKPF